MTNYRALKNSVFTKGAYSLVPIRAEDMESIRQWRNAQMAVLRQKQMLTTESQKAYFENTVKPLFEMEFPGQLLFTFLRSGEVIGYGGLVNIGWPDKRAEMSFLVDPHIAADHERYEAAMATFIALIQELVFSEMQFNKVFTETYEFRAFHISILEKCGFIREGRMRQHILESGRFYDSILHSILQHEYVKS